MSGSSPFSIVEIGQMATVARGEAREGFEQVQGFLLRLGYLEEQTSWNPGRLDDETARALELYQEKNGLAISGELDATTRDLVSTPRCAVADLIQKREQGECPWPRERITFAFENGRMPPDGAFDAIRRALASWAKVLPLTFREVSLRDNPDIRFGWWLDPHGCCLRDFGSLVAHADFPEQCGGCQLPKPAHFNDALTWVNGAEPDAYDIESIAAHEVGHLIGLQHSWVLEDVMHWLAPVGSIKRKLTDNDIRRGRDLYSGASRGSAGGGK